MFLSKPCNFRQIHDDSEKTSEQSGFRHVKFTLVELLVVVSIIAILAGILLPSLTSSWKKARAIRCIGNLKQVISGTVMYGDDFNSIIPTSIQSPNFGFYSTWTGIWANHLCKGDYSWKLDTLQGKKTGYGDYLNWSVVSCPSQLRTTELGKNIYAALHWRPTQEIKDRFGDFAILLKQDEAEWGQFAVMKKIKNPTSVPLFSDAWDPNAQRSWHRFCIDNPWPWQAGIPYEIHGRKGGMAFADGHAKLVHCKDLQGTALPIKKWVNSLKIQVP